MAFNMADNLNPEIKLMREISRHDKDDFLLKGVNHFTNMESKLSQMPYCIAIMSQINLLASEGRDLYYCYLDYFF